MMISVFFYSRSGVVAVSICYISDFGICEIGRAAPGQDARFFFEFGMQGVSLEQDSATVINLFASWSWTSFLLCEAVTLFVA